MSNQDFVPIHETEGESVQPFARHWRREHYIPINRSELIKVLSRELSGSRHRAFRELCDLLSTVIHMEFQRELQQIKKAYEIVNPDTDTLTLEEATDEERERYVADLLERVDRVLQRANFVSLSNEEIEKAMAAASDWGVLLNLDLGIFDRLEVYARGDIVGKRVRRRPLKFSNREVVDIPIYQRVAAVFRLRDRAMNDDHASSRIVYLKLLKNVPKQDVDMILPGSRVRMSMLDSGKILLPTLSGIVIALIKIFKGALLLAFAGFYGMVAFAIFISGTLAYGFKSFSGYQRIRDKYELNMTKSLYYQHLANNAGVLFRLIDEGAEQELREMILAYFLLWNQAGPDGWTEEHLDQQAEEVLKEMSSIDIDFEVQDAMQKLRRFELTERVADGRWRAVDIDQAMVNVRRLMHRAMPLRTGR